MLYSNATDTTYFYTINTAQIKAEALMDPNNKSTKELHAAFDAFSIQILKAHSFLQSVTYHGSKLGPFTLAMCPSNAAVESICHYVSATFEITYNPSDVELYNIGHYFDAEVYKGGLDCKLRSLYPSAILRITNGGECQT